METPAPIANKNPQSPQFILHKIPAFTPPRYNTGTRATPFRTIQKAAEVARPGDVITVHEGIYRERINPPRGGTSDHERIVYRTAPGERVTIKGSEVVKGWKKIVGEVWEISIPNSFFGDFNPFDDLIRVTGSRIWGASITRVPSI